MSSAVNVPAPRTAAEIATPVKLSRKARELLGQPQRPIEYLHALVEQHCFPDALRFLAHAMPNRQGVWWACLCTRYTMAAPVPVVEWDALQTAVHWVLKPGKEQQDAAERAAATAGLKSAAGCAVKAAGLSGVGPKIQGLPRSPPGWEAARLIGASVLWAIARGQATAIALHYRQFLAVGLDVECGLNHWEEPNG